MKRLNRNAFSRITGIVFLKLFLRWAMKHIKTIDSRSSTPRIEWTKIKKHNSCSRWLRKNNSTWKWRNEKRGNMCFTDRKFAFSTQSLVCTSRHFQKAHILITKHSWFMLLMNFQNSWLLWLSPSRRTGKMRTKSSVMIGWAYLILRCSAIWTLIQLQKE